jgi:hypothetical protein
LISAISAEPTIARFLAGAGSRPAKPGYAAA